MKNIILMTALCLACSSSFAKPQNVYKDYINSSDKKALLTNHINNYPYMVSIIGQQQCENVSEIKKLVDNKKGLYLQASCDNLPTNFHIFMVKKRHSDIVINSCEAAIEKFEPELQCKEET